MKRPALGFLVLVGVYVFFALYLGFTYRELPARVATHFNWTGEANGWMTREDHVRFLLLFGTIPPLFILITLGSARYFPIQLVNLPHREYWLAPERRVATFAYLLEHGTWLSSLMVGFVAGLHTLLLQANRTGVPHLSDAGLWTLMSFILCGLVVWILALMRHFSQPK